MPKSASPHALPFRFFLAALCTALTVLPVAAGTPTDPQIQDAHEQQVDNSGMDFEFEEIVPIDEIIARCADGDGCRLRLSLRIGTQAVDGLMARLFSADDAGDEWTIHAFDGTPPGNDTESGDSTDGVKGSILVYNTGAEICEFYESGTTNDYRLSARATSLSPPFVCRLRIDD